MEHIQKVFMRLSQCEMQTKCTVVLQKTSLQDSTSNVFGSILMSVSLSNEGKSSKLKHARHQQEHISRNKEETHLHLM